MEREKKSPRNADPETKAENREEKGWEMGKEVGEGD